MSSSYIKTEVRCLNCGSIVEIDFCSAPLDPITVLTRGGKIAPHLQKVLDSEPRQQQKPLEAPTAVAECSSCRKPAKLPGEGSTFRKKGYRGKLSTVGRRNGSSRFGRSAEFDSDRDRDSTDDQLLSEGYRKSRYGADREDANKQTEIREWHRDPKRVQDADIVLDGMTVREIQDRWGIPKSLAGRGKAEIKRLANLGQKAKKY